MRDVQTFPIVLRELTVLRVVDLNTGMRRVTLGGEQLRAFHKDGLDLPELRTEGFDDHVKFFFPEPGAAAPILPRQNISSLDWPGERPNAKDYTPRRYDPVAGEIDFDFVRHPHGSASAWAESAQPGRPAWIAGPKMSHSHPAGADWLLILGDETALPAIGRWLEEMPEGARAVAFIEVGDDSHRQDLPTRADATITWLSRKGAPAGTSDLLVRAVRGMAWLPGTVFAWAAGEARTLKAIRRHLTLDRRVPRHQLDITGYWRFSGAEDETHERLHTLTEIAPGLAVRAAVTLGLVDLIHRGIGTLDALTAELDADAGVLGALLAYLAELEVVAVDAAGIHTLTPVGEELAEDDHSAEEYDLNGIRARLDLSLTGLAHAVRTGRPPAPPTTLPADARMPVEETALWIAPGVLKEFDWAGAGTVTAGGNGAGSVVNALVKAYPSLRVRIAAPPSALGALRERVLDPGVLPRVELVPSTRPVGGETVLLSHVTGWLPDEDAVQVLAEIGRESGTVVLVEELRSDENALEHLRLACTFGGGLRTAAEMAGLIARAALQVRKSRDIGWGHRLWVLEP
ncbi:SIP domain-containing protein [Nonomuraea typhae]|uniref:SIP domain-containing protein n=1 Tax=Nonomuraea typhae TaxID=2603600 RepID=A0ABW7YUF6_9ACTN